MKTAMTPLSNAEMLRIYRQCVDEPVSSAYSKLVSSVYACESCGKKQVNQSLTIHETFWGMGYSEPVYYCDPCFFALRLEGLI